MRKNKLLLTSIIVFGLFLMVNSVSASTVETLQPAQTITYDEGLIVNDTARFDSAYIGKQDVGGVTFFNGTIVNNTTTDESDNPVTFGDNVRVDGTLFRTELEGDDPLKIGDTLRPEVATLDVGTSSNKWRNAYFSGSLAAGTLNISGDISVSGTVDGVDISDISSTYVSQSSPTWDSRTGYATVPASSCIPESDSVSYTFLSADVGYSFYSGSAAADFYCPVYVPHGATINSAKAYVRDSGAGYIIVGLYRTDLSAPLHYFLGTGNSINSGSGEVEIDINSINEVVDNSQNAYHLNVFFSANGANYKFHGAIINYTYTEPY